MDRPHYKFWPRGLPKSITVPATSLWHNLATSAARYPDKAALVFFGRVITYREFEAQAERLAGTLHALGVQRGDRVLLDMQNCRNWSSRTSRSCVPMRWWVPVNPMNRAEELKHYITDPRRQGRHHHRRPGGGTGASQRCARARRAPGAHDRDPVHRRLRRRRSGRRGARARVARLAAHAASAAFAGRWPGHDLDRRHERRPCAAAARRGCQRHGAAALHQRHHRPAQGLHPQPFEPEPQRLRGRALGAGLVGGRGAGSGADVPHHRHREHDAHVDPVRGHAGHHAALGPATWPGA